MEIETSSEFNFFSIQFIISILIVVIVTIFIILYYLKKFFTKVKEEQKILMELKNKKFTFTEKTPIPSEYKGKVIDTIECILEFKSSFWGFDFIMTHNIYLEEKPKEIFKSKIYKGILISEDNQNIMLHYDDKNTVKVLKYEKNKKCLVSGKKEWLMI
jgi:hypothetical protein